MELKVSKYKSKSENTSELDDLMENAEYSSVNTASAADYSWRTQPRETVDYDNGVSLHRQAGHYILSIGDQEMEIEEEDVIDIAADPDIAFEIVIAKRRKYGFNTASDNFELVKYK